MSLSFCLEKVTEIRNWLYDNQFLSTEESGVPVVSVGNITLGGTGKTPFIKFLANEFESKDIKLGVVSRGYKGAYEGVQLVDPSRTRAAHFFGDEPTMLAKELKSDVVVSRKRIEGVKKLSDMGNQLVLADDAFQHRKLRRDFDIVLIDATEPIKNYKMFPKGRLREGVGAIQRCHYIVVTKYNLLQENKQEWDAWFEKTLEKYHFPKTNILYANYSLNSFSKLNGELVGPPIQKAVLLSGIAKPSVFEDMLRRSGLTIEKHYKFKDHHEFTVDEIVEVVNYAKDKQCVVITTAKDAVKINAIKFLSNVDTNTHKQNAEKIDFSKDQSRFSPVDFFVADLQVSVDDNSKLEALVEQVSSRIS